MCPLISPMWVSVFKFRSLGLVAGNCLTLTMSSHWPKIAQVVRHNMATFIC